MGGGEQDPEKKPKKIRPACRKGRRAKKFLVQKRNDSERKGGGEKGQGGKERVGKGEGTEGKDRFPRGEPPSFKKGLGTEDGRRGENGE